MYSLSATDLAAQLQLSKGRISQYVSEGKLDGCFTGDGRARRFDPALVASALGRGLDKGQMLGNGLTTRRAIRSLQADGEAATPSVPKKDQVRDGKLDEGDVDQLEIVKLATASEQLRKLRRDNAVSEGHFVLAVEVERQVVRAIGQEVREFESVLREGARAIADNLGVDFREARKILTDRFRAHRKGRAEVLEAQAAVADPTEAERASDI